MRALGGFVVFALVLCFSTTAFAGKRALSAKEIRKLLTDATVEGRHLKEGYSFKRHYDKGGTFKQEKNTSHAERTGKWSFSGSQICIQWDGESRKLCRVMETDQKGNFWKMLKKRNGKRVKIVTYSSFVDAKGKDLTRKIKKKKAKKVDPAPKGILAVLVIGALLLVVLLIVVIVVVAARSGKSGKRKYGKLVGANNQTYKYSELLTLDPATLDQFAWSCISAGHTVDAALTFEAIAKQAGNSTDGWRRIFHATTNVPDDQLVPVLEEALDGPELFPLPVAAVTPNYRGLYLLGQVYVQRANKHNSKNEAEFTRNRDQASHLFGLIRSHGATPAPSMHTPYRGGGPTLDYVALAGPACEAAMYLKYVAPVVSSYSSSSHSGGG